MTKNKKVIQITLIFIGLLLILSTYFIYPRMKENKALKEKIEKDKTATTKIEEGVSNTFENVSYKALYNTKNPFTVSADSAKILKSNPDIVYMNYMKVSIHMNDGRVVVITSDRGRYNKLTYDCFFEDNVKATDSETTIRADNLDFLANEDIVTVYNNVNLLNDKVSLEADKVRYDFNKKRYKISMFDEKNVKIKLIQ